MRIRVLAAAAAAALVGALTATATAPAATAPAGDRDPGGPVALQAGTYDALAAGDYTGTTPVARLLRPGSIGLGTFDRLDGEAVVLDGTAYRVGTSGTPRVVRGDRRTPFLQTVDFRAQARGPVRGGATCAGITARIDRLAGTTSGLVAVRLVGRFTELVTRSVPPQDEGVALTDAVAEQTVFPLGARRATLVGFRTGSDLAGLSPVGLHLHGLTRDRRAGGHVLSCVVGRATLEVAAVTAVRVQPS